MGTSYLSPIFTTDADEARITKGYIAELVAERVFTELIVTKVTPNRIRLFREAKE